MIKILLIWLFLNTLIKCSGFYINNINNKNNKYLIQSTRFYENRVNSLVLKKDKITDPVLELNRDIVNSQFDLIIVDEAHNLKNKKDNGFISLSFIPTYLAPLKQLTWFEGNSRHVTDYFLYVNYAH